MTRAQRWTLAVVCAATAMLMLDIAVVNTALSAIAADLDTGLGGLQWVVDAYTLPLAATVITAGSLADRFGRRRLFVAGLAVFAATSLLCAAAQSITMLNAARAAQGIGAAMLFAVSLAVLSHAFPEPGQRMRALAVYGATMGGSFAVGPLVGGALTTGLDWRWIFLINLPLCLGCLWILRRHVEESLDPRAPRVDRAGLVTLTGGLFLLVLALLRGNEAGWGSAPIAGAFAGAGVLLAGFLAIEARIAQPMLPLRLFRDPTFTGAQVAAFGLSASLFAMWLYMTLYLQQILGLSAIEAGLVYVPGTLLNFLVAGSMASVGQKASPAGARRVRPRAGRRRPRAAHARRGGHGVVAVPARPAGGDGGHGHPEPDRQPARAELGPARAERARRGRQRHVPPGRHRRRDRGARRARPRGRRARRRATRRRTSTGSTARCGPAPCSRRRPRSRPRCSSARRSAELPIPRCRQPRQDLEQGDGEQEGQRRVPSARGVVQHAGEPRAEGRAEVADAQRHRGERRDAPGLAPAQHGQDEREPEGAALPQAQQQHPQRRRRPRP